MFGNICLSISVAILAYVLFTYYDNIYRFLKYNLNPDYQEDLLKRDLFTEEKLATFNGYDNERIYLAILGDVFDVTPRKEHYARGAQYHYFVGRDASKAFVTGNFKDESHNKDHVYDLICEELLRLKEWIDSYRVKYVFKGKLIGRHYDSNGYETEYKRKLDKRFKWCTSEKQEHDRLNKVYPPCNSKWSAETGTVFWCTKNSGGVVRDWVGVPRRSHMPGKGSEQCVCLDLTKDYPAALFKEYDDCPPNSISCEIK